jgi:hypothetical protein
MIPDTNDRVMTLGAVSLLYWRHHQITADEAQSAEKRTNFAGNGRR